MAKNVIKLTESELKNLISEAAKQTLNELSPEFVAGAYKRASDLEHSTRSPLERAKRKEQAKRFQQGTIERYNKKYGVNDDNGERHGLSAIGYDPYMQTAYAQTYTNDGNGNNINIRYDNNHPEGKYVGSQRLYTPSARLAFRSTKGERSIKNALGKVTENIKMTETELQNLIKESVVKVLSQINKK